MFADLVGYLAARIDTISNDAELFEDINREQLELNGKIPNYGPLKNWSKSATAYHL